MESDEAAGRLVFNLLAEQKFTQTDINAVIVGTSDLVQSEVLNMLNHVSTLLLDNGCIEEHVNVVKQLKTSYTERTLFHSVRNQQSQMKYFESKFGLILPVKEFAPSSRTIKTEKNDRRSKANRKFLLPNSSTETTGTPPQLQGRLRGS